MSAAPAAGTPRRPALAAGSLLGKVASGALAAASGFALTLSGYSVTYGTAAFGATLAAALGMHLLRFPRIVFTREALAYTVLLAYLCLELLWTRDRILAVNTIVPAANFLLTLLLFGSLARFHDTRAVVIGAFTGFAAAAWYTATAGFPLSYPADFSYNAVAIAYLFGLFMALLAMTLPGPGAPWIVAAAVTMAHIMATTSIKANLGVAFGALAAFLAHARHFGRTLRRNFLFFAVLIAGAGYVTATSETISASLERGYERVTLGVEVLRRREGLQGYTAFNRRVGWLRDGLVGWTENPVFGHGVEAFRARYGITSHSTAVDLLYNSGLAGFTLFYGVIASVFLRLRGLKGRKVAAVRALAIGAMTCFLVVSLSGNVHTSAVLAALIALIVELTRRAPAPAAP